MTLPASVVASRLRVSDDHVLSDYLPYKQVTEIYSHLNIPVFVSLRPLSELRSVMYTALDQP